MEDDPKPEETATEEQEPETEETVKRPVNYAKEWEWPPFCP